MTKWTTSLRVPEILKGLRKNHGRQNEVTAMEAKGITGAVSLFREKRLAGKQSDVLSAEAIYKRPYFPPKRNSSISFPLKVSPRHTLLIIPCSI